MLFKFGKFWKTLLFLTFSWTMYAVYDYEFVVVTLLALIYSKSFKDKHSFL